MDTIRGVAATEAAGYGQGEDPPPDEATLVTTFSVENDETRPASHRFVNATKHEIEARMTEDLFLVTMLVAEMPLLLLCMITATTRSAHTIPMK